MACLGQVADIMSAEIHSLPPPMNYVFVDFENVHEIDLAVIGTKSVNFVLFLGANHTKLDVKLVEKMMEHASSVQLRRLQSSGKDALDFTLAFYLGQAATLDPKGYFHVISKDKGFDPMIEHLRSRHLHVRRHDSFTTLSFSGPCKTTNGKSEDPFTRVLTHLRKNKANRPKRRSTLIRQISGFLGGNGAEEHRVHEVIDKLQTDKHIKIGEKEAVEYLL